MPVISAQSRSRPRLVFVLECDAVCGCPWCAASKAWRVSLTGLCSISGSEQDLEKVGGNTFMKQDHTAGLQVFVTTTVRCK